MNKQTTQIIEFVDEYMKEEVMNALKDTQWQATVNGGMVLKRFIYGKLTEDTTSAKLKYNTIIHDFMTHCMTLVDWEKVGAYYLEQKDR